MSPTSSLHLKILSLAVVVWGLMSSVALSYQGASWVPWMALVLLLLLEAYSGDAKPAVWSRWSAGLKQVISPGMLPYYVVLMLALAFGPGQMRHAERPTPYMGPVSPTLAAPQNRMMPPAGYPNVTGPGPSVRPQGFPGSKFPRPAPTTPGASAPNAGAPAGQAVARPLITAKPGPAQAPVPARTGPEETTGTPGAAKTASPAVVTPVPSPSAGSPTSSAKPSAAASPAK